MQYKITFLPNGEQEGREMIQLRNFYGHKLSEPLPAFGFPEEQIYDLGVDCEMVEQLSIGKYWTDKGSAITDKYPRSRKVLKYKEPIEKKEEKNLIDRQELINQVKGLTEEYADYFAHMETRIGFTAVLIELINNQPKHP